MKRSMSILMSLALTFLLATAAVAGWGNDRGNRHQDHLQKLKRHLVLTTDQEADIRALIEESRARMQPLREERRSNRDAMRQVIAAESFDKARARELAREQADLKVESMAERHAVRQKIDGILTDAQRGKLAELRNERQARRQEHRGKRDRFGTGETP